MSTSSIGRFDLTILKWIRKVVVDVRVCGTVVDVMVMSRSSTDGVDATANRSNRESPVS